MLETNRNFSMQLFSVQLVYELHPLNIIKIKIQNNTAHLGFPWELAIIYHPNNFDKIYLSEENDQKKVP